MKFIPIFLFTGFTVAVGGASVEISLLALASMMLAGVGGIWRIAMLLTDIRSDGRSTRELSEASKIQIVDLYDKDAERGREITEIAVRVARVEGAQGRAKNS